MKTHFSFRLATGTPYELCERLKELNYEYAPIDDINSTYGFVKHQEACEKFSLRPVFGVSIYVCEAIQAKKPVTDLWSFYAIDDIKPINDLVRKAFEQGRTLPRVGFVPLLKYSDLEGLGNVIKVSGYRARLEEMNADDPNLYVGLSPACAKGFVNHASELGFKFFAMQEARYVREEDRKFYEIAAGFNADLKTYPQHILGYEDWYRSVDSCGLIMGEPDRAEFNKKSAFSKCTATLKKGDLLRPEVDKTLEEMCREGIARLGLEWTQEYEERLQTELTVIRGKKFDDYFFLMADLIQWSKNRMLVGPGRGSSAGSLVCYLLDITSVDPIKYGLLFFRFLDPNRQDWPDIDTDFSDQKAAINYLVEKYGRNRVARLGTVGNFMAKNTTNEVAKQLSLPRFEFDSFVESLPKYAAGDAREDKKLAVALGEPSGKKILDKYPNFKYAGLLTGNPASSGQHASGVIATHDDLTNYVAIDPVDQVTMCDMRDAESLNLIKIDVLALSTLEVIAATLEMANLPSDYLNSIPLDDQNVFDVLNTGKFTNVFQFDGHALRQLTKTMRVETLDDLSILSALSRPGASVGADMWVRRRKGLEKIEYPHPILEPYLKETLGALVYQETVMLIAREVAELDWSDVAKLRKAIGKSLGPEAMKPYSEPFINGLVAKGIPIEVAEKFWQDILGFSSYSFNKSHTICYGIVGYWTCYLKAYYPLEFVAASLSLTKSLDKQVALLKEAAAEGVGYLPYDAELSTEKWRVGMKDGKKVLVGPLQNIRGLGPKSVSQILGARARGEPLPDSLQKKLTGAKTEIDSLTPVRDAILTMNWRAAVNGPITRLDQALPQDGWAEYNILGLVSSVEDTDENAPRKQEDRKSRGQEPVLPGNPRSWAIRIDSDETKGWFAKVTAKKYEEFRDQVLTLVPGKTIVALNVSVVPSVPCGIVKSLTVVGEME